mgnify:FL=1|tara:strand:- start:1262 stop:1627 length:366 start_codon:yes stop_codon:yes gene_type:complete
MTQYKIARDNSSILFGNICIPKAEGNRHYKQFIQDVAEQGMSIVEGPDVKSPSYVELRVADYPSLEDQFDMQFHDQANGTTTWKDTIQEIKNRHPKTITGGTTIGPIPDWVQEEVDAYNAS